MTSEERKEVPLDRALADELRVLSREGIEPPRDLWPEIEAQAASHARPTVARGGWYAVAAALLLTLALNFLWRTWSSEPVFLESSTRALSAPTGVSAAARVAHEEYVAQRAQILRSIEDTFSDHPEAVRRDIRESARQIEEALLDMERSLARGEGHQETELAELYALEIRLWTVVRDRLAGQELRGGTL